MNKEITKREAQSIIERSIVALGLEHTMHTDPYIMKDILYELKLDDLRSSHKRMNKFFRDIISQPQNIQPLFDTIKKGLVSKHPALIEFAGIALKNKWFAPSDHIMRAVHVLYVLEALTAAMCNSHDFFIEVQDHYKSKEQLRGINALHTLSAFSHALGITHSIFETVKALSVDPAMIYFRIERGLTNSHLKTAEVKKLLRDKKINYLEYKLLSPIQKNGLAHVHELMRINIYEAGVTEYKKGLKTNALCAHELSENIKYNPPRTMFQNKKVLPENTTDAFYQSIIEKDNLFPVVEFSQEWVSLYTTWNMAFILSELDDLDILFPKLFIPSIINAEPENFVGVRIISLWLSINHVLFRKCDKKTVLGPKKKIAMSKALAKINKKYAFTLAKREMHEDSRILNESYNTFFSHPIYNILKLVRHF